MAQIIVQRPEALVVLLLLWLLLVWRAWPRRFKPFGPFAVRLILLALLAGAVAQPEYWPPASLAESETERTVVLVDQSASLGAAGQARLRTEAERLASTLGNPVTLFFGDRPVALPLTQATDATAFFQPEQSNLAEALVLGGELLAGQPGRLVLLSDGAATAGEAVAVAAQLGEQGITVDVLLDNSLEAPEVRLLQLDAPPVLRQGEPAALEIVIDSPAAAELPLRVSRSGEDGLETVLAEGPVRLEPGLNQFSYDIEAGQPGLYSFWAEIEAGPEDLAVNNRLGAVSRVYPPPEIMIVSENQSAGSQLAGRLQQTGFETRRIGPEQLPDRLPELEPYDGIVLLDVSARSLALEQMLALQTFSRELGRGLVVTGGRNSFSLGNYADTPLAELLPLDLEPPPREERPPVAMLLIVDHSGSMVQNPGPDGATKLAMAKEAAIRAASSLGPEDLLGVLMFDEEYEWIVPFQPVSGGADLLNIEQAIATIPAGGGTRIYQALEVSLPALMARQTGTIARHAVLFTDGRSFDQGKELADYEQLIDTARQAGVTLSTIAIGHDADELLLQQLAEAGRGRYHFAATPEALPELTISESDILQSEAVQAGEFEATQRAPHPMLRGLDVEAWPALGGYIAMTPKPRAEIPLQVGPEDPLLAVWGYGLGRVAAWSADTGQEWAAADWPEAGRFWGQVVGYTLPAPELAAGLQLQIELTPAGVAIFTADSLTAAGLPVDLAPTEAVLTTPEGKKVAVSLRQIGPGRYQQQVQLSTPGPYRLSVSQGELTATTGFALPYPAEYGLSAGAERLREIAAASGGETFGPGQTPGGKPSPAEESRSNEVVRLWPWLLQAALVLWPLEIAWRRWARLRIQ